MKKEDVIEALLASLERELRDAIAASRDAADYATDEEARAESKWDTQGLEASYLAAGQADKARQLGEGIDLLRASRSRLLEPQVDVGVGALVTCDLGGTNEIFFIAPAGGGHVFAVDGREVTVVTLESPIASRLLARRAGESFSLPTGVSGSIVRID